MSRLPAGKTLLVLFVVMVHVKTHAPQSCPSVDRADTSSNAEARFWLQQQPCIEHVLSFMRESFATARLVYLELRSRIQLKENVRDVDRVFIFNTEVILDGTQGEHTADVNEIVLKLFGKEQLI